MNFNFDFRPIVLSGPSGGGKSTMIKKLLDDYPKTFVLSVSCCLVSDGTYTIGAYRWRDVCEATTRNPRPGEIHGTDYFFVTKENMKLEIDDGKFLEYNTFGGNFYGTKLQFVRDIQNAGRICIFNVDLNGVKSFKKTDLKMAKYILIQPPNLEELENRLRKRGESGESLNNRLLHAKTDMENISINSLLFDHIVINDNLERAYAEFCNVLKDDMTLLKNLHNCE